MSADGRCYGLLSRHRDADALLAAAREAYGQGYRDLDAYAPFRVDGLSEAVGGSSGNVRWVALAGGVLGAASAYLLQYYSAVFDYPLNVGGRPLNSWPAFMPVTVIMGLVGAGVFAFIATLRSSGLPRLYHPLFDIPEFERASQDRFFLCIRATDPLFDPEETRQVLGELGAEQIWEVPP